MKHLLFLLAILAAVVYFGFRDWFLALCVVLVFTAVSKVRSDEIDRVRSDVEMMIDEGAGPAEGTVKPPEVISTPPDDDDIPTLATAKEDDR